MAETTSLRIITRGSRLALLQVDELLSIYPGVRAEVTSVTSYGDRHKEMSLMSDIPSDFFTRELDNALLSGTHDIAVHSAKDLPYPLTPGLEIYALTEAHDKSDALVTRDGSTLAQLPSGARVGTSSNQRKAELLQVRPDLTVVAIRGTIEERMEQVDNGSIDALIVASCALNRLSLSHRRAERLPFATHPLQGNLAVVGVQGRSDLRAIFSQHDVRRHWGRVTLVGFGPGNPDLLTIAGDKALLQADSIFYDDLTNKEYLQRYKAEKVYVGKRAGRHSFQQNEINNMMHAEAVKGRNVVRLKGGDPMIFAHGREEYDYLSERLVSVDIIPGVSAALAAASSTHIPLTARGVARSVSFALGHGKTVPTPSTDTVVYYMGGRNLSLIAQQLTANGWEESTPVALHTAVTTPQQRSYYTTLAELRHSLLLTHKPVLMMVGKVVDYERRATLQRVMVTSSRIPDTLRLPWHQLTHVPLIRLTPLDVTDTLRQYVSQHRCFDYIIFTSHNGVDAFFNNLSTINADISAFGNAKVLSVGPVTTQWLQRYGCTAHYEAPSQSAEGIVSYLRQHSNGHKDILLPRSDKGLTSLSNALINMGHEVVDLSVYTNTPCDDDTTRNAICHTEACDKLFFASPSGVKAYIAMRGQLPRDVLLTAIGDTTFNAVKDNCLLY